MEKRIFEGKCVLSLELAAETGIGFRELRREILWVSIHSAAG